MIRPYRRENFEAVIRCFDESVRSIGARYYSAEQIEAWAPASPDLVAWESRLCSGEVLIADVNGAVAGFVRVEENGLVDLLYVHPAHERRGIGRDLLEAACVWANRRGVATVVSEVSLVARPLFEAIGFRVEREQSVERRGVRFLNFHMVRDASDSRSG